MPIDRLAADFDAQVEELARSGVAKGDEPVTVAVRPPRDGRGPRVLLEGEGEREFIRMNSNSYLGLSRLPELGEAEEKAARAFGVGPGAVRFISGTYAPHVALERALADFHGREAAMLSVSAYTAVMGVLQALVGPETAVISDALNHNCIVNGIRLARPLDRKVYNHLDLAGLERALEEAAGQARGAVVVTDGVFSMRGDWAPLDAIRRLVDKHDPKFPRNAVLVVDDSHGVGAFGATGRGTEEATGGRADVLVATLGKALGVNGGYVAAGRFFIRFLREKNPFTIYSNPIAPGEAAAALRALEIARGEEGRRRLERLRELTARFRGGLQRLGFDTLEGAHPVVPLFVRDTERTARLVRHLRENGVLATGLNHPVVPKGEQLIRFQVTADLTPSDVDAVLEVLARFPRA